LRQVFIASTATEAPCPSCGVLSGRVHQRVRQRLADVPVAGPVEVLLVRRRFACAEQLCARRTFVEVSVNRPGIDGGFQPPKDGSHGATEEVPRRAA
jgi:hypothetical protein